MFRSISGVEGVAAVTNCSKTSSFVKDTAQEKAEEVRSRSSLKTPVPHRPLQQNREVIDLGGTEIDPTPALESGAPNYEEVIQKQMQELAALQAQLQFLQQLSSINPNQRFAEPLDPYGALAACQHQHYFTVYMDRLFPQKRVRRPEESKTSQNTTSIEQQKRSESTNNSTLYRNNVKNREFDQETSQNFDLEAVDHCL